MIILLCCEDLVLLNLIHLLVMLLSFSSYPHFPLSHQLLHLVSIEVVHVVVLRGLVILILIERTSRKAYIDGLGGCLINSVI